MAMVGLGVICAVEIASGKEFIGDRYILGAQFCIIALVCAVGLAMTLPGFIPPFLLEWWSFRAHEQMTQREREEWEDRYHQAKTPEEREALLAEREHSRQKITMIVRRPAGMAIKKGVRRMGARAGARRRR
jgi:hypothetical protein